MPEILRKRNSKLMVENYQKEKLREKKLYYNSWGSKIYSQCFEFDCSPDCKFVAHFYDTQAFPWFRVKPMQILVSFHYFLSARSVELQMNKFD